MAIKIDLKALLESGAHFGHQSSRWNPKMKSYLYTVRDGVHVFDLVKTKKGLEAACEFAEKTAAEGGKIIFVGTKRQAETVVKEEAQKVGMPWVTVRWLGGTITNWEEIKKQIDKFKKMEEKRAKGEYKNYTKKEQILIDREIEKKEKFLGGLKEMEELPAAILVIDTKKEHTAVREANRKKIPVIGLVDSNADPDLVDYVIPANDDAVGAVKLVVGAISEAISEGLKKKKKKAKGKKKKKENDEN